MNSIHVLLPVLNEERRLPKGLDTLLPFMEQNFKDRYIITIVDNGSTDKTESIANSYISSHDTVKYIKLAGRGVGLAFRSGCAVNTSDIIGYMDVDLSTDITHLLDVDNIFADKNINIVNGSRLSKGSDTRDRKWYRTLTSNGLKTILKIAFNLKIDDAICGFKFFRKDAVDWLIKNSGDTPGWFYLIELLIRAERKGLTIKEIPVRWLDDHDTKVKTVSLSLYYLKEISKLQNILRSEKKKAGI